MIKKLALVFALMMSILCFGLVGCKDEKNYSTDFLVFNLLSDDTYGVVGVKQGLGEEVNIPPEYNGKKVTTLCQGAFYNKKIFKVTIPNTITKIEEDVFYKCYSLYNIEFESNSSLVSIGSQAFAECYSLYSFTATKNLTTIGTNAFIGCYKLVEVCNQSKIEVQLGSNNNGYIGFYALRLYINGSSNLCVKDDFMLYGDNLVLGYVGQQSDIALTDNICQNEYSIYSYAFYCTSLNSLTIPEKCSCIYKYAFYKSNFTKVKFEDTNWYSCDTILDETGESITLSILDENTSAQFLKDNSSNYCFKKAIPWDFF